MAENETEKQFELRIKNAERAHDKDWKGIELHNKQIEAFATAAMRAPALVAAGGVAASLGFYSANYVRLAGNNVALDQFNSALSCLFLGLLLTVIAPGLAYFSQLAYIDSLGSHEHIWLHPYSVGTARAKIARIIGDIFRWLCVLTVVLSIAAVTTGGISFLHLVATL